MASISVLGFHPELTGRENVYVAGVIGGLTRQEVTDRFAGAYFVDVGIFEKNWAYAYDYHWHVYPYTVINTGSNKGVLHPPHRWQIEDC